MIACPKCKGEGLDVTCSCGGSDVVLAPIAPPAPGHSACGCTEAMLAQVRRDTALTMALIEDDPCP